MEGQSTNGNSNARTHGQSQAESNNCENQSSPILEDQAPSSTPTEEGQTQNNEGDGATNSRKRKLTSVIVHEYPLVIVEHHGFRKFVVGLQPLFKVPCRNTLKSDIMKIYDYERDKTMSSLGKSKSKIAVTTDMWTSSNQKKGFMAITAHLVNDNWEMQSRIMRFIYVPCPHTAEALANVLYESLCDWNIDRNISTVTVDNCSTNDLMITMLLDKLSLNSLILGGELFHMRCCAHILNLIVQDGLCVIGDGIEKVRDSVFFWTATPKRVEKFEESARHLAIDCSKKLALDCKTRWNSTYLMLSVAIVYKDVFKRLKIREPLYKSLPTGRDWELASRICEKLQLFYKVTLMFSGTKYPTANIFFESVCEIRFSLSKWCEDEDEIIKMMAQRMLAKFDKYWSVIHGVMGVAAVLDPRFKLKIMEYAFPKLYGADKSSGEIIKLKELVYRLFQDYEASISGSSRNRHGVDSSRNTSDGEGGFFSDYYTCIEEDNPMGVTTELDHYLEEKVWKKNTEFDILSWWKTNGFKYPTLQKIARDILAIPISTVASESAFSTSGRLVSPHRSRLHPKTLEALMCAQSWLLNEIRATCSEETDAYCKSVEYEGEDGDGQSGVTTA